MNTFTVLASTAKALTRKCPECDRPAHYVCLDPTGNHYMGIVHDARRALFRITMPGKMVETEIWGMDQLPNRAQERVYVVTGEGTGRPGKKHR